ncbi:MAG: DinB family protein [Planctomycetota bacterium]
MTSTVFQLVEDNLTVLRQGHDLVRVLDDAAYSQNAPSLALSGVGPHLRHVVDFYERFLTALEAAAPDDGPYAVRIDYDARDRDPRVETDPNHALAVLERTIERLRAVPEHPIARVEMTLQVRSDGSPWIDSTVARELQSLVSHTVHHYALIAIAVRSQGGAPDPEFGVAPSTLRHWSEQKERERASDDACAL